MHAFELKSVLRILVHRTEFLSFGDIRQMALAYAVSLGAVNGSQRTHMGLVG